MKKKNDGDTLQAFKRTFEIVAYGSGYETVFNDFMEMCICAFTRNPTTGLSYYEGEYLERIEPYKKNEKMNHFPHLLGILIAYMEKHKDDTEGNDLLGTFYEQELSRGRNGQFFTPFHICELMASLNEDNDTSPKNVLDPCCGSGRMLLAYSKKSPLQHRFYGIDIDPMCVKMTAINLFLNGRSGEVLCANALNPNDFRFAYRVSHFPLGIFKIESKEESRLWQMNQHIPERPKVGQLSLF